VKEEVPKMPKVSKVPKVEKAEERRILDAGFWILDTPKKQKRQKRA
jgi:hypothetical protein